MQLTQEKSTLFVVKECMLFKFTPDLGSQLANVQVTYVTVCKRPRVFAFLWLCRPVQVPSRGVFTSGVAVSCWLSPFPSESVFTLAMPFCVWTHIILVYIPVQKVAQTCRWWRSRNHEVCVCSVNVGQLSSWSRPGFPAWKPPNGASVVANLFHGKKTYI